MTTRRASKERPRVSAGGRPAMAPTAQARLRAALLVLRRRHTSWEAVARAIDLSVRTVMRIAGGGGGASTDTVGRVAVRLLPGLDDETSQDGHEARAARALLDMTTDEIRALGAVEKGEDHG